MKDDIRATESFLSEYYVKECILDSKGVPFTVIRKVSAETWFIASKKLVITESKKDVRVQGNTGNVELLTSPIKITGIIREVK